MSYSLAKIHASDLKVVVNPSYALNIFLLAILKCSLDFIIVCVFVIFSPIAFMSAQSALNQKRFIYHLISFGPLLYNTLWISLSIASLRQFTDVFFSTGDVKIFIIFLLPAFLSTAFYFYLYARIVIFLNIRPKSYYHLTIKAISVNYLIVGTVVAQLSSDIWAEENRFAIVLFIIGVFFVGLLPAIKIIRRLCGSLIKSILLLFLFTSLQISSIAIGSLATRLPSIAAFSGDHYTVKVVRSSCYSKLSEDPAFFEITVDTIVKMEGFKSIGLLYSDFYLRFEHSSLGSEAYQGTSIIARNGDLNILKLKFKIGREEEYKIRSCNISYGVDSNAWFVE